MWRDDEENRGKSPRNCSGSKSIFIPQAHSTSSSALRYTQFATAERDEYTVRYGFGYSHVEYKIKWLNKIKLTDRWRVQQQHRNSENHRRRVHCLTTRIFAREIAKTLPCSLLRRFARRRRGRPDGHNNFAVMCNNGNANDRARRTLVPNKKENKYDIE